MTTKAKDWHYEQEVRFIYDLSLHSNQLICENNRYLVSRRVADVKAKPDKVDDQLEWHVAGSSCGEWFNVQ